MINTEIKVTEKPILKLHHVKDKNGYQIINTGTGQQVTLVNNRETALSIEKYLPKYLTAYVSWIQGFTKIGSFSPEEFLILCKTPKFKIAHAPEMIIE